MKWKSFFCTAKEIITRVQSIYRTREKRNLCQLHIRQWINIQDKRLQELNAQTPNLSINKWVNRIDSCQKKKHKWPSNTWKKCSMSSAIREMRIKATLGSVSHQADWLVSRRHMTMNADEAVERGALVHCW